MSRYEHLPVYKKTIELGVYLESVVRDFRDSNNRNEETLDFPQIEEVQNA